MLNITTLNQKKLIQLCQKASKAILKYYKTDIQVHIKADQSPFTLADTASHDILTHELTKLYPDVPIISEEMTTQVDYETRKQWPEFWLVDPLDGSKEFIKQNDQFCIIISLIQHNEPVFGLIYSPVSSLAFIATKGEGAYRIEGHKKVKLTKKCNHNDNLTIIGSLSHSSPEFESFVKEQKKIANNIQVVQIGSALKFCKVAEGEADMYPRFVPTMEWDTAAGQLLVEECGKTMIDCVTKQRLKYNKQNLKNNSFIVS
ncbi:3'(2'),5'-bisphosphate nucleotidase [Candidatus Marinamargulisbacteria bacterium SCGC AG-414-C22]|nr:3'(2'),5'-bisphosphate nucleotidase [Candidatus Marinamargulisbacteria bacterium SCGC AG-414-C22]